MIKIFDKNQIINYISLHTINLQNLKIMENLEKVKKVETSPLQMKINFELALLLRLLLQDIIIELEENIHNVQVEKYEPLSQLGLTIIDKDLETSVGKIFRKRIIIRNIKKNI